MLPELRASKDGISPWETGGFLWGKDWLIILPGGAECGKILFVSYLTADWLNSSSIAGNKSFKCSSSQWVNLIWEKSAKQAKLCR